MIYFFLEANMENQSNIGNQNVQPVGQNPVMQSTVLNKPKANFAVVFAVALACSVVFGVGGYFLGRQSFRSPTSYSPTSITNSPTPESLATLTPAPDETSGWTLYSNTKYGYTVKYPQGWEPNRGPGNVSDSELAKQRDIDFYDPSLPGGDPGTGLNIQVNELDANGTSRNCSDLDDCFSKTFKWLTDSSEINKTSSSFLRQPSLTFSYQRKTDSYTQSWKYVYFLYKGNAYNLHISTNVTREKLIFELFDKILSTFKFVN